MPSGQRFQNAESVELMLKPHMLPYDVDATVHLNGAADDCFGARWRNMCALGGTVRGPHIAPHVNRRLDLLTKLVNENDRFPSDPMGGDGIIWPINSTPCRAINIGNVPWSPMFGYIFPELDMFAVIAIDDPTIISAKELGGAQGAFSNEAACTLKDIPYTSVINPFPNPQYSTIQGGPNEDLSGVAHLNP